MKHEPTPWLLLRAASRLDQIYLQPPEELSRRLPERRSPATRCRHVTRPVVMSPNRSETVCPIIVEIKHQAHASPPHGGTSPMPCNPDGLCCSMLWCARWVECFIHLNHSRRTKIFPGSSNVQYFSHAKLWAFRSVMYSTLGTLGAGAQRNCPPALFGVGLPWTDSGSRVRSVSRYWWDRHQSTPVLRYSGVQSPLNHERNDAPCTRCPRSRSSPTPSVRRPAPSR